ncbi:hypothetical protein GCM10007880_52350 [Mesorhizobium amorphae]|nr:hypothetical protein GCM10007880_52350 [Mesorhizobium amorphae]
MSPKSAQRFWDNDMQPNARRMRPFRRDALFGAIDHRDCFPHRGQRKVPDRESLWRESKKKPFKVPP